MSSEDEAHQPEFFPYSHRDYMFELLEHLGAPGICDLTKHVDWHLFFAEVFACKFKPDCEWIATDNITESEKEIVRRHLPGLVVNFMDSHDIQIRSHGRETFSGFVLFRVELLPVFKQVLGADHIIDWISLMIRFIHWERLHKKAIMETYSPGNFSEITTRLIVVSRATMRDIKLIHPWWREDYGAHDGFAHISTDEYSLVD